MLSSRVSQCRAFLQPLPARPPPPLPAACGPAAAAAAGPQAPTAPLSCADTAPPSPVPIKESNQLSPRLIAMPAPPNSLFRLFDQALAACWPNWRLLHRPFSAFMQVLRSVSAPLPPTAPSLCTAAHAHRLLVPAVCHLSSLCTLAIPICVGHRHLLPCPPRLSMLGMPRTLPDCACLF